MNILTESKDNRINTHNILIEMSYKEYLKHATRILDNNPYQRKRVTSSNTIYSQLKQDMIEGCIIPPIVLALSNNYEKETKNGLEKFIQSNMDDMLILDGLQRTYTLIDAYEEVKKNDGCEEKFLSNIIRAEIYYGINRFGTLYRMLTLNTGQTPMSMRHQIEILYSNLDLESENIKLLKEADGQRISAPGEYKFKDAIDGFVALIQGNYLPMDRTAVLETIKSIETISKEDLNNDLFTQFVKTYHKLFLKINEITSYDRISDYKNDLVDGSSMLFNESGISEPKNFMYATSIESFFSKSQTFTGFGGAIGFLRNKNIISSLNDIEKMIERIDNDENIEWFIYLTEHLHTIKQSSKKLVIRKDFIFTTSLEVYLMSMEIHI